MKKMTKQKIKNLKYKKEYAYEIGLEILKFLNECEDNDYIKKGCMIQQIADNVIQTYNDCGADGGVEMVEKTIMVAVFKKCEV